VGFTGTSASGGATGETGHILAGLWVLSLWVLLLLLLLLSLASSNRNGCCFRLSNAHKQHTHALTHTRVAQSRDLA
jgi:hypothetical protein